MAFRLAARTALRIVTRPLLPTEEVRSVALPRFENLGGLPNTGTWLVIFVTVLVRSILHGYRYLIDFWTHSQFVCLSQAFLRPRVSPPPPVARFFCFPNPTPC